MDWSKDTGGKDKRHGLIGRRLGVVVALKQQATGDWKWSVGLDAIGV